MSSASAQRPASIGALFWAFSWLALQGFGGVLAVVQRELVEKRHWLTLEEFVEDWAVAQIMPGANVVNLSLIVGDRYFGWKGALAALPMFYRSWQLALLACCAVPVTAVVNRVCVCIRLFMIMST